MFHLSWVSLVLTFDKRALFFKLPISWFSSNLADSQPKTGSSDDGEKELIPLLGGPQPSTHSISKHLVGLRFIQFTSTIAWISLFINNFAIKIQTRRTWGPGMPVMARDAVAASLVVFQIIYTRNTIVSFFKTFVCLRFKCFQYHVTLLSRAVRCIRRH